MKTLVKIIAALFAATGLVFFWVFNTKDAEIYAAGSFFISMFAGLIAVLATEKIQKYPAIVLSAIGIILFWVFGFMGLDSYAAYSFFAAGYLAYIALVAIIVEAWRNRF